MTRARLRASAAFIYPLFQNRLRPSRVLLRCMLAAISETFRFSLALFHLPLIAAKNIIFVYLLKCQ